MRYICLSNIILVFTGLLCGALVSPSHAQLVTIQTEPVSVEYYRLPDEPLDPSFTTYSAGLDIQFRDLSKTGLTQSGLIDEYIRLEGYKKVASKGDVQLEAAIGEFMIWGEFRKNTRSKSKDKDGNERTITKHYIEVKYSLPVAIQVKDKNGRRLIDKYIFTNSDTRTWISHSFNDLSDLDSYWRSEKQSRLNTLHKERLQEGLKAVYDLVNSKYGFRLIRDNIRFEMIGKKKHPEYNAFKKNLEIIKAGFKLMTAEGSLDPIRIRVKPALEFYTAKALKYSSSQADEERLKHICLYNLALANLWLEKFDEAEAYANSLLEMNERDRDVRRILQEVESVRNSLSWNNRVTRHGL